MSILLLKYFNEISEAPDAVPRLRRFILDLAVRGKLVEQDQNDEPAGELLKRIEAERRKFFKEAVEKRTKSQPPILAVEIPIPNAQNVVFARLSVIARIEKGNTGIQKANPGRFPLVSLAAARASCDEYQFDAKAAIMPLISSTGHGHASIKRLHYQEGQFALANILCAVIPFAPQIVSARFLYEYFCAYKEQLFVSKMIGTANVSLTMGKIAATPVPIISPTAQNRVYELMALCDELETARTQRETRRDRLLASTLHGLNNGDAGSGSNPRPTFKESVRFYFNHLPRLTTRPEHIKQLRQTILNLAVRGKLVEQDPGDEPAALLFARARSEKALLIKQRLMKATKTLTQVGENDIPFEVPPSWIWVRLGEACQLVTSGSRDWAKYYSTEGAIFVRMGNLSKENYNLRLDNIQHVKPPSDGEGTRTRLADGDILISITGDVGLLGLIPAGFEEAYINQHTCVVRLLGPFRDNRFFPEFFRSPFARQQFHEPQRGIKNSFRLTDVLEILVPLPPLAEQRRIVAKIDHLMLLCDGLEASLSVRAAIGTAFCDATVTQALNYLGGNSFVENFQNPN